MKKLFGTFFVISLLLVLSTSLSLGVSAEDLTDDGLWSYTISGENAELTAYHGSAADVYIPSAVSVGETEYSVAKLGDGIFRDNDTVNSVTLGDGISVIGDEAFYDCDSLVCIVMNEDVLTIGDRAFSGCDNFNSVILYDNIESIGIEAFSECPKLVVYCNKDTVGYNYAVDNSVEYKILNPEAEPELYIVDGITYYISNGEASVLSCETTITNADIPSFVNGYPVTAIQGDAFKSHTKLSSVIVPSTVKTIGVRAFSNCDSLKNVTLNEGLTSIGSSCFYWCSSLSKIDIPSTVTTISSSAFAFTAINEITLPEGITEISNYMFQMTPLKSLKIPSTVTRIGKEAFWCISYMRQITIPGNVKLVDEGAFYNAYLKTVVFEEGVETIADKAFYSGDWIESIHFADSISYIGKEAFYDTAVAEITFPKGLKTICDLAFAECPNLKEIHFNDGLETIGSKVFDNSHNIKSIYIPESVTSIAADAFSKNIPLAVHENSYAHSFAVENDYLFYLTDGETPLPVLIKDGVSYFVQNEKAYVLGCDASLTSVSIVDNIEGAPVTEICENAFLKHKNMVSISLPDTLETIGMGAFKESSNLVSISIPDSVSVIGEKAFSSCKSLKEVKLSAKLSAIEKQTFENSAIESIIIPGTAEKIGDSAFHSCLSLRSVTINNGVTSIGERAFYGCKALETVTLPESLANIGKETFGNCSAIEAIDIPGVIVTIPEAAFSGCSSLESVTLSDSIRVIDKNAFANCTTLSDITLPKKLSTINNHAFYSCDSLAYIVIPKEIDTVLGNAFSSNVLTVIYSGSKAEKIAKSSNWLYVIIQSDDELPEFYKENGIGYLVLKDYAIAVKVDPGMTEATINDNVKNVPVTRMYNTFYCSETLEKVTLPQGLIDLGDKTFYQCTALKNITLPQNVKSIGDYAFYHCDNLESVALNNGLDSIGDSVFINCSNLTSLDLPDTITNIGKYSFQNSGITELKIPKNIKELGAYAFWGFGALTEVTIHDEVTKIGERAFGYCRGLKEVVIPESVTSIGNSAFESCSSLEKIQLPKTLDYLGHTVFFNCYDLKSIDIPLGISCLYDYLFSSCYDIEYIEIPDGVIAINYAAFRECKNLKSVIIPDTVKTIESNAFASCTALNTLYVPESVTKVEAPSAFSKNTILLVSENSFIHTYAKENNLLHFIVQKTENPEIAYGAGISGTVSYTDGSVASGVNVELLYEDGSVKESVVTDENGAYIFTYAEVGKYTIRATDADKLTASDTVAVKRMNVFDVFIQGETDLVLKNSWSISGTVGTDDTAKITLSDTNGKVIAETGSANDSTFVFENVPNGSYVIKAETENASVTAEVTVFNADVSDIVIEFPETELYATVKGYVEVEDREFKHHRKHWVEVTIYNSDGVAVAVTRTGKDGEYVFKNLPADDYSIVAQTEELRPDKKKHHMRTHKLTGYAYVTVTEAAIYEIETIILYEENDEKAMIKGKVTANGETQDCEVTLSDVFRNEIAHYTTKKNGQFNFTNINDGLYFITAVTKSDGMGFAVVVVRNGHTYGDTHIKVEKHQHIRAREDRWFAEIPEFKNREEALSYRERIAEEKRYFDGLSKKEQKQFSSEYKEYLNRYAEWIADYEYSCNDESVKIENGGMIFSGDELESEEKIELIITVEKSDGHTVSEDGIKTHDDYIQQSIENAAGDHTIAEYYDISLLKKNGNTEQTITSVSRDTDTTGKIRITIDIPEKYRGHKHYSFVHVHNGEALTLTDLDNNPDTITFEIDRFSSFTLVYTDEEFVAEDGGDERFTFVGGQIRTEDPKGLRFVFSIDKAFYDSLEHPTTSSDTGLGFGSVIMPKKYLGEEKLVKDLETETNGKKKKAKTAPAVNLFEITETKVLFTVCILDIPESGYTEEYVAVPYATYMENGEEITVYGNMTANVTVYAIAELAYADEKTSEQAKQYIYDNILSVVDPEKYPVAE